MCVFLVSCARKNFDLENTVLIGFFLLLFLFFSSPVLFWIRSKGWEGDYLPLRSCVTKSRVAHNLPPPATNCEARGRQV